MAPSPELLTALQRLDLGRPPPEGCWVDGAARAWGEPERLRVLLAAGQRFRIGLHGPLGSGKSSELERWRGALEGVANVSVARLEGAAQSGVGVWVAALSAGLAALPAGPVASGVREQLSRLLSEAQQGLAQGLGALHTRVIAQQAPVYLANVEALSGKPLLLLLDALDLLPPEEADTLLGPNGTLLDPGLPALVVTVPHAWALERPAAQRHRSLDTLLHLPPFPVFDRQGRADPAVVSALADGLARRLGGVGLVAGGVELLERVALSSGGVPRHAVQILRQAVLRAALGGGKVDLAGVIEGERELRQDLEESARNRLPQLVAFRDGGTHQRDVGLVLANVILGYEGAEGRYYLLHPLLRSMFP